MTISGKINYNNISTFTKVRAGDIQRIETDEVKRPNAERAAKD